MENINTPDNVKSFDETIDSSIITTYVKENPTKKLNFRQLAIIIFGLLSLLYVVFSTISATKKLNLVNNINIKPIEKEKKELNFQGSDSIASKIAFYKSRINQSKTNQIGLSINLVDSSVILEIKGVFLQESKIERFTKAKFYSKINNNSKYSLFSEPLTIKNHYATIAKEPIIIKKAPKDTSQISKNSFIPDTLQREFVFVSFETNEGFRINLIQQKSKMINGLKTSTYHLVKQKLIKIFVDLGNIFTFKVPDYQPVINIFIPEKDLISIYRALPEKAQLSFLLNND